ncbi:DUF1652 domain-containing protein [Pseudomonas capsici]|uniref:DUF1652 domain-containing protein n=1 Tax=Pseudomonas capsici TaxID=2810614 RepID=UPI0021F1C075|nr:DUF1652 domain-containing protein [Pseudomonas capsici]MCV4287732.1 DUF1652 domain-containing protein [Pseudomonas capsici]
MFSRIELQHMLEKAFLPTLCNCSFTDEGYMTLELFGPQSLVPDMLVSDIQIAKIHNGRALAELVRETKREALLLKLENQELPRQAG